MNRNAMMKPLLTSAVLTLALALSACSGDPATSGQPQEAPLAGAKIGAPFTLTNSQGAPVQWSDFDGQFRIVYFGYAYCPDICPMDVQHMMQGYAQFAREKPQLARETQPIFITIDPERDTPAIVGEFTSAFSDRLIGLTGTPEQIDATARAFAVYYARGETSPGGGYLMDHSRAAYLMGRKGEPIALLPVDKGAAEVAAELARWTR